MKLKALSWMWSAYNSVFGCVIYIDTTIQVYNYPVIELQGRIACTMAFYFTYLPRALPPDCCLLIENDYKIVKMEIEHMSKAQ